PGLRQDRGGRPPGSGEGGRGGSAAAGLAALTVASTIRTVCAHDCPDMCSLIAHVEDGRLLRLSGDPDHPMTAGFVCTKVNRDHEMLYSPDRVLTPLRRTGAKGSGAFAPITWEAAL